MIAPWDCAEVCDTLSDLFSCDTSLSVRASDILKSRPDRDRYFLDLAEVNQGVLLNDVSVIGHVFLEALNHDILSPMNVGSERHWFTASTTRSIIADLLIKVALLMLV